MSKIRKAIITAAGRGTRQYPASKTVQKELFPLVDIDGYSKPTLQIIAQEAVKSGIEEICIVANPHNVDDIKAHFARPTVAEKATFNGKEWLMMLAEQLSDLADRVHFVVQETQEGFGHAVYQANEWAGGDPVVILLGDHVYMAADNYPHCSRQVMNAFDQFSAPVSSVDIVEEEAVTRLGVLKCERMDNGALKVVDIVEKPSIEEARKSLRTPGIPADHYLAHFGIHAFPNTIFEKLKYLIDHDIRRKNEFQLTSAQELLMRDSPLYIAQQIHGRRFDMGQPDEFIMTQFSLAMASPYRDNVIQALGAETSSALQPV